MTPRKKSAASSSQSSSGSSSGSSSSSSTTSGSESDSDSSSSSQEPVKIDNSIKSNSIDTKQCEKTTKKNSDLTKPHQQVTQKSKAETEKQRQNSKSNLSSTEDDDFQHDIKTSNKKRVPPTTIDRKKVNVAPIKQKTSDYSTLPPPQSSGAKLPPSVIKQQQKEQAMKIKTNSNALIAEGIAKTTSSKISAIPKKPSSVAKIKKKSIFSPDNTSESDDDDKQKPKLDRRMSSSSSGVRGRGRPRKYPLAVTMNSAKSKSEAKLPVITPEKLKKEIKEELSTTTTTSSSNSSSTSDSESSTNPSPSKRSPKNSKSIKENGTDSDIEDTKPSRKSSRMSTNRKSKHLLGTKSETESEVDSNKRSHSKSPVKKSQGVATKAKTNHNIKKTENKCSLVEDTVPVQRMCPLNDCDSNGHLSGIYEKHFTIDACPNYHNVLTVSETKQLLTERTRRDEDRKIALLSMTEASSKKKDKFIATNEQRVYQQKIRDIRVKFKPNITLTSDKTSKDKHKLTLTKEPNLEGLVSDYDLQLFRDAQAIASENIEKELKRLPASKGTKYVTMGKFNMEVWYPERSVYPDDLARLPKLYLCEFCLRYQKSEVGMKRHSEKCVWKHPPGDEIYRKAKLCVWQVDGKKHKQYCQHLCLLAKFFLDHKTLYYDVEPFLFYIMTIADSDGCHIVGYFSKEKNSFLNYNVSCILTLPPYQRKGFGRLLIDFSYLLTRVECKIGSPEKPLSDLGLISYRSYWKDVLLAYLCSRSGSTLSVKDISQEMAINSYDIVSTLQALGMMKYWKGKHIILKKQDVLEEYEDRNKKLNSIKIDPTCLKWTPFVPPQQSQLQVASKSQPS